MVTPFPEKNPTPWITTKQDHSFFIISDAFRGRLITRRFLYNVTHLPGGL